MGDEVRRRGRLRRRWTGRVGKLVGQKGFSFGGCGRRARDRNEWGTRRKVYAEKLIYDSVALPYRLSIGLGVFCGDRVGRHH